MTDSKTVAMTGAKWYALRDFKRPNAIQHAWEMFRDKKMNVFTPKKWVLVTVKGKRIRKEVAFIPDLLFVHETRAVLDPIIETTATLQYRFRKYGAQNEPIVVPDADMDRFIQAVKTDKNPIYYKPSELTSDMIGKTIVVNGGPLNGYEGELLKIRGSKKRRLIVKIKDFLAAAVEVNTDYVQVL